jgi:hypothetical protein
VEHLSKVEAAKKSIDRSLQMLYKRLSNGSRI